MPNQAQWANQPNSAYLYDGTGTYDGGELASSSLDLLYDGVTVPTDPTWTSPSVNKTAWSSSSSNSVVWS